MNTLNQLLGSSLGKKYVMAITGLALFGFLIIHLVGNLQIYLGWEALNNYAAFLKSKPMLVWGGRAGLLLIVSFHIWAAVRLTQANRAARPVAYAASTPIAASYASRTMVMSGLIIASFIIYHLLHFTVGAVDPELLKLRDAHGHHDVYRMVVVGFSKPVVSLFYIVAMGLLGMHLSHGLSALFQSLGLRTKAWGCVIDVGAKVAAAALFLGNCSIPLAVLAGVLK